MMIIFENGNSLNVDKLILNLNQINPKGRLKVSGGTKLVKKSVKTLKNA